MNIGFVIAIFVCGGVAGFFLAGLMFAASAGSEPSDPDQRGRI